MWKFVFGGVVGLFVIMYVLTLTVPGFIMFGVVVFLFIMSIFLSYLNGGIKAVGIAILVFAAGFLGFTYYYNATCGPNSADVKVMKPMAEKISAYIVKHGIPESLKDIPDLPYGLEGCERSEEYLKSDNNGGMEKTSKKQAILYNIREKCHFKNIELEYWLQGDLEEENYISVSLKMVSINETVYDTGLALNEDNQFIKLETDIGSYKSTGICNSMKQ